MKWWSERDRAEIFMRVRFLRYIYIYIICLTKRGCIVLPGDLFLGVVRFDDFTAGAKLPKPKSSSPLESLSLLIGFIFCLCFFPFDDDEPWDSSSFEVDIFSTSTSATAATYWHSSPLCCKWWYSVKSMSWVSGPGIGESYDVISGCTSCSFWENM